MISGGPRGSIGRRSQAAAPARPASAAGRFPSHAPGLSGLPSMTSQLFIIGATGKTGTQLIDIALARGHEVTAFVRSPDKITREHPLLRVVPGDPLDADALARALPGHDAVLSALGVPPRRAFRPHTVV